MSKITDLKDAVGTKTLNLVMLTVVTGGLFPIMWIYKNGTVVEKITGKEMSSSLFAILIAVCIGLGSSFAGAGVSAFEMIAGLSTIAAGVLYIVWAFKARSALQTYALNEHKVDLRMNAFYTFFLSVYYINYCMNDLPDAQRKQQILNGQSVQLG